MKKIFIVCAIVLLFNTLHAQNKISGTVYDHDDRPMAGATVFLPEINKGTISDKNGFYELSGLPAGKLKIQFSFIGYSNVIETILLAVADLKLNIRLQTSIIKTEEIVITGGYSSTQHENAVKIEALKPDILDMKSTPNFTEVLTKIPGVNMISKGSGVSKPVIRGLSMNDILVLNNGVRFENYQYSDHHPLGIDESGIEDVEIIKGPASLLYGSDAIGGVINFIKERPAPVGTMAGDYTMQLFSNTLGMTNNFGIKGASKKVFGGFRIGHKTNSDFLQGGGDYAPNTRFTEYSIKTNTGFTGKTGTFKLFYDYSKQRLGLAEEEAFEVINERGRKPEIFYQQFNSHLLSSQNKLYFGNMKLDINSAYQNTGLIHFGESGNYELQMSLGTLTYETKLYLPSDKNSEYIIGLQGMNQSNTNLNNRETILLPDAVTNNYSVFGLLQRTFFRKLKLQTGIRYDNKKIKTESVGLAESPGFRSALEESFGSFSGSVGATFNATEKLLFRANIASAFRTPNLAELTSNGLHETRYETGNKNLVPENSYEFDLSMHFHQDNFTFDLAGFHNRINNYIFITPTGSITESGIAIYEYMQSNSALTGGEAGIHFHPVSAKWLHLLSTGSTVTGKQLSGDYLPFVPAGKLKFEIRAEKEKLSFVNKPFISVNSETTFAQNKVAPEEEETSGYSLVDLTAGGKIGVGTQVISFNLSVNNLFDKKYIDHMSTLQEAGLFNPGRNIAFSIKIPFAIPLKE